MSYILNIETATTNCSVSVALNGQLCTLEENNSGSYSHAEKLHLLIQKAVENTGIQIRDLAAIAVSKGPGSYTGLRIGVSAAKGLAYALNIPLIAVPTLQALACQIKTVSGFIIPLLDARRMEVYTAVYDNEYKEVSATQAKVLSVDSFSSYLKKHQLHFIGNGVEKTKAIIKHPNANFVEGKLPSANEMCVLSHIAFKKNSFEDVAYFEPFYLKDFISHSKK